MKNFIRLLFVVAPVVGILLYYIIIKQTQVDAEFNLEGAKFEREWQEFNQSMARTPEEADLAKTRALEAQEEIDKAKEDKRLADLNKDEFEVEFQRAMQEASKAQREQN